MITAIIIGTAFVAFIVGYSFGRPKPFDCCHWDYDIKCGKVSDLETRVFKLESENSRLNFIVNNFDREKRYFQEIYAAHCYKCNRNFYSKDMKGQEVADMLKNITLTSEEIAKKLDIEIK